MATTNKPIREVLTEFAEEVLYGARINLEAKRRIRGRMTNRVATGKLRDDLKYTFWKRGRNDLLIFTTKNKATRNYADVIEKGRRPYPDTPTSWPPWQPIRAWMKVRGFKLRKIYKVDKNKRGQFAKQKEKTEEQWEKLAKRVARSIGIKGIEGIRYMKSAVDSVKPDYKNKFNDAIKATIQLRLKANKYIK